jgi:hypothetical protein
MKDWSLSSVLASLHDDIQGRLSIARRSFAHPGTKGDASEGVWIELLESYLPKRYQAAKAHVVDSNGVFSEQIDVLIFDRQYSPFILTFQGQMIVPAESVYAVFETKQTIDATLIKYAQDKVASVRRLHRTSLPIPHAGGVYPPKPPIPIIGGVLSLESEWIPALGASLEAALLRDTGSGRLDLGCVASHGHFAYDHKSGSYGLTNEGKPATAFLLKLISQLQFSGTVPMIDVDAYSAWLAK